MLFCQFQALETQLLEQSNVVLLFLFFSVAFGSNCVDNHPHVHRKRSCSSDYCISIRDWPTSAYDFRALFLKWLATCYFTDSSCNASSMLQLIVSCTYTIPSICMFFDDASFLHNDYTWPLFATNMLSLLTASSGNLTPNNLHHQLPSSVNICLQSSENAEIIVYDLVCL